MDFLNCHDGNVECDEDITYSNSFLKLLKKRIDHKNLQNIESEKSVTVKLNPFKYQESLILYYDNLKLSKPDLVVIDDFKQSLQRSIIESHIAKRKSLIPDFQVLHSSMSHQSTVSYDEFNTFAADAPNDLKRFFTSRMFLIFPKNKKASISTDLFLRYICYFEYIWLYLLFFI